MAKKADPEIRPEAATRLAQARLAAGFKTAKDATKRFAWVYDTYIQHENGQRGIGRAAKKYASAFKVSVGWLLNGEGQTPHRSEPPAASEPAPSVDKALKDIQSILESDRSLLRRLARHSIETALSALDRPVDRDRIEDWSRIAVQQFLALEGQRLVREKEPV